MSPIPLWVEPCAGSLAVGLRLLGLPRLVGWMGGKGGYADAILHALHLQPRQGAREVWLADVLDWSYCWEALAHPGVAHRAADLIDEWRARYGVASPRQVRALWDDLLPRWRAEGTPPDAEGAARWLVLVALSAMNHGPDAGPAFCSEDTYRLAGGSPTGARYGKIPARLRRWPAAGAPLRIWRDARAIPPAPGVVLLDPPYVGATRYEATCTRDQVVSLAEDYRRLGALVVVCEAEALPELLALGWHALDLREASATEGKPEWLTSSAPPQRVAVPRQLKLWSAA